MEFHVLCITHFLLGHYSKASGEVKHNKSKDSQTQPLSSTYFETTQNFKPDVGNSLSTLEVVFISIGSLFVGAALSLVFYFVYSPKNAINPGKTATKSESIQMENTI